MGNMALCRMKLKNLWSIIGAILIMVMCDIVLHVDCLENIVATKGESQTFQCKHKNPALIQVIGWELTGGSNQPVVIATIDNNNDVEIKDKNFSSRLNIDKPSGDLKLSDIKNSDAGKYRCFLLINGFSENTEGHYNLSVVASPSTVSLLCSDDPNSVPSKSCDDLDQKDITSISCSVISKPASNLRWVHSECQQQIVEDQECVTQQDKSSRCTITVSNLCKTKYYCLATFMPDANDKQKGKADVASETIDLTSGDSRTLVIALILVVVVILIIMISIGVYCWRKKLSQEKSSAKTDVELPLRTAGVSGDEKPNKPSEKTATPESPSNTENNSPPANEEHYSGDLVHIGSKESTGEKERSPEDMQLARQDSITGRKEDDPFMENGEGLNLQEDDSSPRFKRDDDKKKSLVPAYNNPAKMSMHTKHFYNAAKDNSLKPNQKLKYTKIDPDGTQRIFEVETGASKTDSSNSDQLGDVNPRLLGNVRSESPIIEEPESNDEESISLKK